MFCICKPSNLRPAPLREFHTALSNLALPFILRTSLILLPPPPAAAPTTILPICYADFIENTPVLLELSYTSQFNTDLNFFSLLDPKTDYTAIN